MKALIALLLSVSLYSNTVPQGLIGKWQSANDEFVMIKGDGYFCRMDQNGTILAEGTVKDTGDGILVVRSDVERMYTLPYYIGKTNVVIGKPENTKAWLLQRLGY